MANLVEFEKQENIAVLTLNRPEAMNAMSKGLLDTLNAHITAINNDKSIHCTIITGSKQKAFCAGADLKERKGMKIGRAHV